ncbi:MAG: hypothetical protein NTW96_24600 [Planctomycetia bacterium]|nr:hypothetical protein [Planctomycetia bacterium]
MNTMDTQEYTDIENAVDCLQFQHSAIRVQFTWFGLRKVLDNAQQAEIADDFDAKSTMLSASKKLFDPKHPAYRSVAKIKREITAYWKYCTLPFPEPGIRLIPQAKLEDFEAFMQDAQERLRQAVSDLQDNYEDLRERARTDLGRLFNEADYPADITSLFSACWNVENVSPPDYLLAFKPEWYEREMQRIRGLFNNAVELAEQEFLGQFSKLVEHLTDMLTDNSDGTPKAFKDASVDKLRAFIERFRDLSVKSNDDLEKLVDDCDSLTRGVSAEQFKQIPELRQHVAGKLAEVKAAMEQQMVIVPRRKITRRPAASE